MSDINSDADFSAAVMLPSGTSSRSPKGSPEWWRDRLGEKLQARSWRIRNFENYYGGTHKLAFATDQFRKAFGGLFSAFSDNFMQIVVDSVDERLAVEGFRIPIEGTDPEALLRGDDQAWNIWQANQMDSESQLVHTDALVDGMSYVIVGPGDRFPEITGESALECIVEQTAGSRRRIAALKCWHDEDGFVFSTLYLPNRVFKWVSDKAQDSVNINQVRFIKRSVKGEQWPLVNPSGVVPVIPFRNRPRLTGEGRSEIEQLIPLQDAINKLFMDMLVASEFTGFVQRWATGIEIPTDPETNQPLVDVLKTSMDRFLHTSNENAHFGTLPASELSNYTGAIAMQVQHLASRSSTPPHYFLANMGNFPSGEALKAAETGLVSKVRRRMRGFGESWEEVMALALLTAGERAKAASVAGEVIWRDPESRSESEHIDAIAKMAALQVPLEVLWEKSGMFTDTEITRMKELVKAGAPVAKVPEPTTNGAQPAPTDAATA